MKKRWICMLLLWTLLLSSLRCAAVEEIQPAIPEQAAIEINFPPKPPETPLPEKAAQLPPDMENAEPEEKNEPCAAPEPAQDAAAPEEPGAETVQQEAAETEEETPESAPDFQENAQQEAQALPSDESGHEDTADDGCNTAGELQAFLTSGEGGSIALTGDIVWDFGNHFDGSVCNIAGQLTVDMGPYKIIIPRGNQMHLEGAVTFTGTGEHMFVVEDQLNLSYGAEILSSGENAVAIDIRQANNVRLTGCRVAATGENATAIRADLPAGEQGLTLELCDISGTRAAVDAPGITVDGCAVSGPAEGTEEVERVAAIDRSLRLYGYSMYEDADLAEYMEKIYGYGDMNYAFIDPETGSAIGMLLPGAWENVPDWPPEPGSYSLTIRPEALPEWFPVEIPDFEVPLNIVEAGKPWLVVHIADAQLGFINMGFLDPDLVGEDEDVLLYYPTDGGENWGNVMNDYPLSIVDKWMLSAEALIPETNYWFFSEIIGKAGSQKSNVIYYPNVINYLDVDFSHGGADPDEDDFGDQGEKAPSGTIIPAPEAQHEPESACASAPGNLYARVYCFLLAFMLGMGMISLIA